MMADAEGHLGQVYGEIAAAGLDPGRWQRVVDLLGEGTGIRAHLWGFDRGSGLSECFVSHGIDGAFLDSFARHYVALNPWPLGLEGTPAGAPVPTRAMCAPDRLRRSEFHAGWLLPQGDIGSGGGVVLVRERDRFLALGGMIERRREDRDEDDWLDLLGRLGPALRQALDMNRALSQVALDVAAAREAPEDPGAAVVAVAFDGRILVANGPAEALLREGRLLAVDARQVLRLPGARAQARLEAALRRLRGGAASVGVEIGDLPDAPGFDCRVARLPAGRIPFAPLGPKRIGGGDVAVVVLSARAGGMSSADRLTSAFGLSVAEAEVVLALAEGRTPREIAEARGVSVHTVRNQVKAALAKTESRRQVDLVRLVQGRG